MAESYEIKYRDFLGIFLCECDATRATDDTQHLFYGSTSDSGGGDPVASCYKDYKISTDPDVVPAVQMPMLTRTRTPSTSSTVRPQTVVVANPSRTIPKQPLKQTPKQPPNSP